MRFLTITGNDKMPYDLDVVGIIQIIPEGTVGGFGTNSAGDNLLKVANGSTLGPAMLHVENFKIPMKAGQILNSNLLGTYIVNP